MKKISLREDMRKNYFVNVNLKINFNFSAI